MSAVDAGVVFLPRYTTLVGDTVTSGSDFTTPPMDVSRQGGVQFQFWRSGINTSADDGTFKLYLEESLDAESWALGPSTPKAFEVLPNSTRFFAYSFRLRWFRLRIELGGTDPMVTCWSEGLLRAGDGGAWGGPQVQPGLPHGAVSDATREETERRKRGLEIQKRWRDAALGRFDWNMLPYYRPGYAQEIMAASQQKLVDEGRTLPGMPTSPWANLANPFGPASKNWAKMGPPPTGP